MSIRISKLLLWLAGVPMGLLSLPTRAEALEVYLRADRTTLTMPDGRVIPMWGFALDNATFTAGNPATVPGPPLVVPPGDDELIVHLKNNLPEPTSIVVPGQVAPLNPVTFVDARGRTRVRSFNAEAAVGGGTATYRFTGFAPGTYLYESGTHQAVQVQMGLYGPVKKDSAPGYAYSGVPYAAQVELLYSEIDPALHDAVNAGRFGPPPAQPPPPGWMTSTMGYSPKYFLVNGKAFSGNRAAATIPAGTVGQRVLLRLRNAGLRTHVPLLPGLDLRIVAEDGRVYVYPRAQYSAFLPAGKTLDVILEPLGACDVSLPLFDRRLHGGMLVYLAVGCAVNPDGGVDAGVPDAGAPDGAPATDL